MCCCRSSTNLTTVQAFVAIAMTMPRTQLITCFMLEICVLYQDSLSCGYMILNPRTVNLALYTSFCSLRDNGLTPSGAMALARALQHNKSLKELK